MLLSVFFLFDGLWVTGYAQPPVFPKSTKNIGVVRQAEGIKTISFDYHYTGDRITYVEGIETDCHCVNIEKEHLPLLPEERGTLSLYFLPAYHVGNFEEEIRITFHPSMRTTLVIQGEVIPVSAQSARYFPSVQGELRLTWDALHMGPIADQQGICPQLSCV